MSHIARLTSERDAARVALAAAQITRLISERDAARAVLNDAREELQTLLEYLGSDKFRAAPDADHVHIRTDLMPRLLRLRLALSEG